jgi:hypothetical protein
LGLSGAETDQQWHEQAQDPKAKHTHGEHAITIAQAETIASPFNANH